MKKLPDAEFALMRVIWNNPTPITTNQIISLLEDPAHWKPQTVLTLLSRLAERGFVSSERSGRERVYAPLIAQQDYLAFEADQFMERFHARSFVSLVNTLYDSQRLSDADLQAMRDWLAEKE